jgi:6-phosphofructokinase 1
MSLSQQLARLGHVTHIEDLTVRTLGPCTHDSPIKTYVEGRETNSHYVAADDRVLVDDTVSLVALRGVPVEELPSFEAGGPRPMVFSRRVRPPES